MPMSFGGEFQASRKPEETYDFLTDPNRFGPLLPDFQGLQVEDASHFTVKVNVGVSHIRGSAAVKMQLVEAERPRRAAYLGKGSVPGGNVEIKAHFDLEEAASGTRVLWKGEAQIFGMLASLAGGLLEPLAKKNIQKLIDGLRASLA